ncbi:MAG: gliding motility-associated C-terminal domain-containing protein [Bacteroidales bacterium]|nr:gliding motility-associated C-terminal domain-containing protein [Bacteroidales bacterium]
MKTLATLILIFTLNSIINAQLAFIENKGQWPEQVHSKYGGTLYQVYFEKHDFTFNLIDAETVLGSSVHHGGDHSRAALKPIVDAHAYKLHFVDANPNTFVTGKNPQKAYDNYFIGNKSEHWGIKAKRFNALHYKDLYSQVDMKVYFHENGFKYDLVVHPGGSVDEIQWNYEGLDKLSIVDDELKLVTSVAKIRELRPYAYQLINGKTVNVEMAYSLNNGVVSYQLLSEYNDQYDLIIDPQLIFSTYSGATTDNWGFTATSDKLGNVYQGGIIFNTGYPTTIGAYQINFAGGELHPSYPNYFGTDITISKYTSDGSTLLWATHFGGATSEEIPQSLVVNEFNELVILGTTGSTDLPVTSNAFDNTFNGGTATDYDGVIRFSSGTDILLARLSEDGSQLLGSTYIGGSQNDGLNWRSYYAPHVMHGNDSLYYNYADGARGEVITDYKSDIFVGTSTFSSDFPTVNGFQMNSGGLQEGVVFKCSADLSQLLWCSYIGGSNDDAVYSLEINEYGETYVAGGTVSSNFPTTSNAYRTSFQGGTADGFVAHISSTGTNLLASTYFGSPAYDQAYFVRTDKFKNVFITGQTKASGTTLIQNAVYNQPNSGQFIAKFFPGLQTIDWSTTFGTGNGKPNISITAFSVDICNRIYLSGWGREWGGYTGFPWGSTFGTVGMEVTPDAVQPTTDGQDFYIMVMFGDASALDYATFFGEQYAGSGYCGHDHVDGGTSRFDRMGNIYQSVCASCGFTGGGSVCNSFPTTTGAYAEHSGGMNNEDWTCNNAVFRFSFAEDITVADFFADPLICENEAVQFQNTGIGANYYWDFGDGSPVSNDPNPSHQFSAPGTYDITLWTVDYNTCNITDTIVKTITVQDQNTTFAQNDTICLGSNVQIGTTPEVDHDYAWTPASGLNNSTISNPNANPTSTTDYLLVIDDGVCLDTLHQKVVVINIDYLLEALSDTVICLGDTVALTAIANTPVGNIHWSSNPSFTDVLNPLGEATIYVNPNSNHDYFVRTLDSVCQVPRQDTVTVAIDIPIIQLVGDQYLCLGDTATLNVGISNGSFSQIQWSPAIDIISGQSTNSVTVSPNAEQWYVVDIANQRFCPAKDSIKVRTDEVQLSYSKIDLDCYQICTGSIQTNFQGIQPYTYLWSTSSVSSGLQNICAGTYSVIVSDSLGCTAYDTIIVTEPTELQVQIDNIVNAGCGINWNTGSATVSANGGTPSYSYLWSNNDIGPTAGNLNMGTYYVTVSDGNNCTKIESVDIDDPSNLQIVGEHLPIKCHDECNASAWVNIIVDSHPGYTYAWNTGSTSDTVSGLCADLYEVTVTDADGCVRITQFGISNPSAVDVQLNLDPIICNEDLGRAAAIPFGGITPYSYSWSTGTTGSTIDELEDGNYSVILTDAHGCKDSIDFVITSPPKINIDSTHTNVFCETACNADAEVIVQGGVPPYQYYWSSMENESSKDSLCPGWHSVTVTDNNGCQRKVNIEIGIDSTGFIIDAIANPVVIYKGEASQLDALSNENYHYTWIPSQGLNHDDIKSPIAKPMTTTIYQVIVEDENHCRTTDTVIVYVKDVICDEPYIYIPNAFSPNDDQQNDVFYVRGEMIETLHLSIYDRWGEKVFESENISNGWDGTYNDKKVDPAVFVYHLTATCTNKETFEKQGNITVVK